MPRTNDCIAKSSLRNYRRSPMLVKRRFQIWRESMRYLLAVAGFVGLTGCNDMQSQVAQLQQQKANLEQQTENLTAQCRSLENRLNALAELVQQQVVKRSDLTKSVVDRMDALTQKSQQDSEKLAAVSADWKRLEESMSPERRAEFDRNTEAAAKLVAMLQAIKEDVSAEAARTNLAVADEAKAVKEFSRQATASIQEFVAAASKLKDECVRHAKEANDANLVGQLKDSVATMEKSVKEVSGVSSKLQQVETKLQEAETKSQQTATKLQQVETKMQQAEGKVQQADTKIQQANSKVQQLETKMQQVDFKLMRNRLN